MQIINNKQKIKLAIGLIIFCLSFMFGNSVFAAYPKLANYYIRWDIQEGEEEELAKWDVLIVDMEAQMKTPERLRKIKKLNPDILLLAYITSQEINNKEQRKQSILRQVLASGISSDWYLKNSKKQEFSFWKQTKMLNLTTECKKHNGINWNIYLADFVANRILSTGLWDGVFYDNTWNDLEWFTGRDVDLNGDGSVDNFLDQKWKNGLKTLFNNTRNFADGDFVIVGNGFSNAYGKELNGMMIENFPFSNNWKYSMQVYEKNQDNILYDRNEQVNIINANIDNNKNKEEYKKMRFGLTSTLLEDGYFSFDLGDKEHAQKWWYDEYDVALGNPMEEATSLENFTEYEEGIWMREFEYGIAIVNSTYTSKYIPLNAEYEKIMGMQDKKINNGAILNSLIIPSRDGIILRKIQEKLKNIAIPNGSFVRFYSKEGKKLRNGFFAFDEKFEGGKIIGSIQLDGRKKNEFVEVDQNSITITKGDGLRYMKRYPYTRNYNGTFDIRIGDIVKEKNKKEILILPPEESFLPVKVITYYNQVVKSEWFPFGKRYSKKYIADVLDGKVVFVNTLYNKSDIKIYSNFELQYNFSVSFPVHSILYTDYGIVLASKNKNGIIISVFDETGKQIQKKFTIPNLLFSSDFELKSLDIDFDGVEDIVIVNE
jgi:hypothetical protein